MPTWNAATRRDVLKLTTLGGVVFASSLLRSTAGCSSDKSAVMGAAGPKPGTPRGAQQEFFFLQLSDPHWGFTGPQVNPEPTLELPAAIAAVNAIANKPDFVIFTGDLTHTTDDVNVRKQRMTEFQSIVAGLNVPMVKFMAGEHDAAADGGVTFKQFFGDTYYSFDHKGVHFIALDNVSDPTSNLGMTQLDWLKSDLAPLDIEAPIVVFSHRPLWALRADWDWTTPDGQQAIDQLSAFHNVTVFFGHIHQELVYMTGHIAHHAARSLMFALPSPDSDASKPNPVPWDPEHPNANLGFRSIDAATNPGDYQVTEMPLPAPTPGDAGAQGGGEGGQGSADGQG
ncbi:MAG TPA: metallophosphoesterase [Polyangiaceae bacterium]|nr:metallophosphoesterase [Polyangiaceae bacterium]